MIHAPLMCLTDVGVLFLNHCLPLALSRCLSLCATNCSLVQAAYGRVTGIGVFRDGGLRYDSPYHFWQIPRSFDVSAVSEVDSDRREVCFLSVCSSRTWRQSVEP